MYSITVIKIHYIFITTHYPIPNRKPNFWFFRNFKFSTPEYQLSPVTILGLTPQLIISLTISLK